MANPNPDTSGLAPFKPGQSGNPGVMDAARMIGTLNVDGHTVEKWSAPSAPGIGRFFAVVRQPDGVKRMGWEVGVGVPFSVDEAIVEWVREMMPRTALSVTGDS